MTRTNARPAETSSSRYGPDSQPLHVSSILLPVSREGAASFTIFPFVEVIAPRPSHLVFARPPALWGSGGASLTGRSRATHAWDRLAAGTPAHAVTAVTAVPVL